MIECVNVLMVEFMDIEIDYWNDECKDGWWMNTQT